VAAITEHYHPVRRARRTSHHDCHLVRGTHPRFSTVDRIAVGNIHPESARSSLETRTV